MSYSSNPRWNKFLLVIVAISLIIIPLALDTATPQSHIQPTLLAYAAEHPGETVRVIVQKQGDADIEGRIADLGGVVTRGFPIINGFAAELPTNAIPAVAKLDSLQWLSLDAPMEPATAPPLTDAASVTVLDEFNDISHGGNDGSMPWATDWQEIGESDGPHDGRVQVDDSDRCAAGNCLRIGHSDERRIDGRGISRSANLSGASWASLSFSYQVRRFDDTDGSVTLSISADGGSTWTDLETYSLHHNESDLREEQFDITPYISANTQIRLLGVGDDVEAYLYIDNIKIDVQMEQNTFQETLGVGQLHAEGITGRGVTVAVIDSGIGNHADLAGRVHVTNEYGAGDPYGHGTHVAGIIGGDGTASGGLYSGIAPDAHFINLGVSDEFGMAYESDVVDALQWVYENKDTYNIRVVNLSLNSTVEDSYHNSGIAAAVEILWLNDVVVVASAGNKGPASGHNTAKTAPANDPFIIVVGASSEHDTADRADDTIASFSAHGITQDGFSRPDIIAPGDEIYSALSPDSTWDENYPDWVGFQGEYIRLSGTSMAAPMVSGAVALLLQDEPTLTPDQVKYRLLHTGQVVADDNGNTFSYLDTDAAVHGTTTESYNSGAMPHQLLAKMALIAYWANQNNVDNILWHRIDWETVNWDGVNWDSVNWNSVDWDSVDWDAIDWDEVNWDSVNWNSVNWNSVNWNSVNWNSVNWNSVNWNSAELNGIYWEQDNDRDDDDDRDRDRDDDD